MNAQYLLLQLHCLFLMLKTENKNYLHAMLTTAVRKTSTTLFFAVHLYDPTSSLVMLTRCRTGPVTLKSLSAWPTLLHVTSGSGSPDAMHVSVKFCPTLTSDSLSGSVVILGGTDENKKRRYNNWLSFMISGVIRKLSWK